MALAAIASGPDGGLQARRLGRGFVAAYAVAQAAAFLGFIPLLSILLPLKVQALAPGAKVDMLSPVLALGAAEASLANIAAGWLSDRSQGSGRSRGGWIAAGALGTAASLMGIGAAGSLAELVAGLLALQLFVNLLLAPLGAVLADQAPDSQKAAIAGWLSLSHPAATLAGAALAGDAGASATVRFAVLAALVCLGALPFAWLLTRRPRPAPVAVQNRSRPSAAANERTFRRLWGARFCMQCAISPVNTYLLYYVEDVLHRHRRPEGEVALLVWLWTLAAVVGGPLAGRLGRSERRGRLALAFATGGAVGLALLALGGLLPLPRLALLLVGAGYGGFTALDTALAAELAGRFRSAGRDLGLLNLAHTAPQMVTPILAWACLNAGAAAAGYAGLFGSAAGFSLLAGFLFLAAARDADARGAAADARTTS